MRSIEGMHMIRCSSLLSLLVRGLALLALLVDAPPLIVDDAATANPDLVSVDVADPSGFGVSGRTLQAPRGSTVTVVAAGLGGPRFMTFDGAGNLLVAADGDGIVYRFPYANGA